MIDFFTILGLGGLITLAGAALQNHKINRFLSARKEISDEEYLARREARRQELLADIGDKSRWESWEN